MEGTTEMKIARIGIDLAKNVLQVHGADDKGKIVLKKQLKRTQVLPFFANSPVSTMIRSPFSSSTGSQHELVEHQR